MLSGTVFNNAGLVLSPPPLDKGVQKGSDLGHRMFHRQGHVFRRWLRSWMGYGSEFFHPRRVLQFLGSNSRYDIVKIFSTPPTCVTLVSATQIFLAKF